MDLNNIDFEGNGKQTPSININAGGQQTPPANPSPNPEDPKDINTDEGDKPDITGKDNGTGDNKDVKPDDKDVNNNNNSSTGELSEGDSIEFEGKTYTVDATGNLVDDKGVVFKEAKDVASWLSSMEVDDKGDNNDPLSVNLIQDALGISVTDAEGKAIEFTNDANGVKAYINAVIDLKSEEIRQGAINKLYSDNPLLKQFTDYVQLNGSPRGFGEIPDRSGITLDKDNDSQLVAVIKMAATEFGNKSLNDNYIKYLKDSGGLYDEAKAQLAALQEKDLNYRKEIERQAQAQREEELRGLNEYWNRVDKAIENRVINGFKIPESFTKEVNGQKLVYTPKDFYNYLSRAVVEDNDGNKVTGYQRDLNNLTEEEYLNRELLDAWLMFTGGSYKDLINMAVQEDKVRQLRVKSKEQSASKTVKVVKKPSGKVNINDIVL